MCLPVIILHFLTHRFDSKHDFPWGVFFASQTHLAANKSRLYKRAAKDEELGIGVQLKAQEARKIRHYAHYLKADAWVPELASAWSHGDVFERLGVSFVPVAMSIFGNRGEALERFISSVAKISPSFFF